VAGARGSGRQQRGTSSRQRVKGDLGALAESISAGGGELRSGGGGGHARGGGGVTVAGGGKKW
jgi:hypothetical protein